MTPDRYTKSILTLIAFLLALVALRPLLAPAPTHAAAEFPNLQFDQRISRIQVPDGSASLSGRIAIDLRNGNIYGFPADALGYPRNATGDRLAVSEPILLGRFDLSKLAR